MNRLFLAADVGGTNIRAAVVDDSGDIVDDIRAETNLSTPEITEKQIIAQLATLFSGLIEKHPSIHAIGIGFPGFFIGDSGIVSASPNIPRLRNFNLAASLSEALKLPVTAQNDALCAAIGEHRLGAGKGRNNLLHLTLGTGIGGGLVLNGTPYSGEGGMAMEFGHLRVDYSDDARACGCGGRGCIEAYASATAVAQSHAEAGGAKLSAAAIFELAQQGDALATRIIEEAGSYLGMAIAEAVKLLDIHTVTISGGLTGAWLLLHPAIMDGLDNNLIPPLKDKISVLRSTLGDNAGILGAAALAAG